MDKTDNYWLFAVLQDNGRLLVKVIAGMTIIWTFGRERDKEGGMPHQRDGNLAMLAFITAVIQVGMASKWLVTL